MKYSFQKNLKQKCVSSLTASGKVVLAAAPGAGKTNMAIEVISELHENFGTRKTLVLAYAQTSIREQWDERFGSLDHIELEHKVVLSSASNVSAPVLVALPQTVANMEDLDVDLLVVDEAHLWYDSPTVKKIIEQIKPKMQLLLTGSPRKFIAEGWEVHGVTLQEMLSAGVTTDVHMELVRCAYDIRSDAYDLDTTMELRKGIELSDSDTVKSLEDLAVSLQSMLDTRARRWDKIFSFLGKTLIVCNRQSQAKTVYHYLRTKKVDAGISTSSLETGRAINEFKKPINGTQVLVVVNRGVVGFDFPELAAIIDMSCSLNPDRLFQLLCRAVRKNFTARKRFFKMVPAYMADVTYHVMNYVVALSLPKYYYSGLGYKRVSVPVSRTFDPEPRGAGKSEGTANPTDLMERYKWIPRLSTFAEMREGSDSAGSFAFTDFAQVRDRLAGRAKSEMGVSEVVGFLQDKLEKGATRGELTRLFPSLVAQVRAVNPALLGFKTPQKSTTVP